VIILDTGPLYTLADCSDAHHQAAVALLTTRPVSELVVPSTVLTEISWAIKAKLGADVEAAFLSQAAAGVPPVVELTQLNYLRCADLVRQYPDFPLRFVDASIVALAERLGIGTIATVDRRHFSVGQPKSGVPFELVP
jgi:uncharacterized protein